MRRRSDLFLHMKSKPRILNVSLSIREDTQSCPEPNETEALHAWRAGRLNFVGIQCRATIQTGTKRLTLASQGCWGVRSNLGREMAGVEKEECDQLRDALACMGFGHRAIEYAFRKITVEKKP